MYTIEFQAIKEFNEAAYVENRECCCGGMLEINSEEADILIGSVSLTYLELHLLVCISCGKHFIPYYSSLLVHCGYDKAIETGNTKGIFYKKSYRKMFDYCNQFDLIYDHYDYYNIPGLRHDHEHTIEGFLTPVYFSKMVLQQFLQDDNYCVHLGAETYGSFRMRDEWEIPFGININDKIVFWLGDLDEMVDDDTLSKMKPYNVDSDHKLMLSEFYAGQMCCIWAEPNRAYRIYQLRNKLYSVLNGFYGIDIDHLPNEVKEQIDEYSKPLIVNSKTLPETVAVLHKVLVEGVNINALRGLYKEILHPEDIEHESYMSIKLFEGLLNHIIKSGDQVRDVIAPLYLLNDLRIIYDHLLSREKELELKKNIVSCFQLESFSEFEGIFDELLKRLTVLYKYLMIGYSGKSRVQNQP